MIDIVSKENGSYFCRPYRFRVAQVVFVCFVQLPTIVPMKHASDLVTHVLATALEAR